MKPRFFLGVLISLCLCGTTRADSPEPATDVKCGSYCVFVGLKALGLVETSFSAFEKTIEPPGPSGYSMSELERIAQDKGAKTLAVEADLETLATLSRPNACIGFAENHFLIIKWVNLETKTVSLIDPPREYDLPFDEFRKRFSKRSLILGTSDVPPTVARSIPWAKIGGVSTATVVGLALIGGLIARKSRRTAVLVVLAASPWGMIGCGAKADPVATTAVHSPSLMIEPTEHHVGKVFAFKPDQTITLRNRINSTSPKPIHLREIRKSCTCTSVEIDSTTIPAGGSQVLKSTFRLGHLPGPKQVEVEIATDEPNSTPRRITFDWNVVTPLFAETIPYDFGRIEPGQSVEGRVMLMDRGLALCSACQIEAEPNHNLIEASVQGVRAADVERHNAEKDIPGAPRQIGALVVKLRSGGDPGDYHQAVTVNLNCKGILRAKLDVPVDWSIRPSVEAQPARLWLGTHRSGSRLSKRLILRPNDGAPLTTARLTCDPSDLLEGSKIATEADGSLVLDLDFSIVGNPGIRRGQLTVAVGEGRSNSIVVPVSAMINADGDPGEVKSESR